MEHVERRARGMTGATAAAMLRALAAVTAFGMTLLAPCREAHGDAQVLSLPSAAPGETMIVPRALPMPGLSFGAGMVTQVGRRAGAPGGPDAWNAGVGAMLTGSLFGVLQVDVALPLRIDFGDRSPGDRGTQVGFDAIRTGGRIPVPGCGRSPGETGGALGVHFHAAVPIASPHQIDRTDRIDRIGRTDRIEYRPGMVFDHRTRWTEITLGLDVPVQPATDALALRLDLEPMAAARIWLCSACGVSLVAAGRARIADITSETAAGRFEAAVLLAAKLELASRALEIELFVGTWIESPIERTGHSLVGGLTLRRWIGWFGGVPSSSPVAITEDQTPARPRLASAQTPGAVHGVWISS